MGWETVAYCEWNPFCQKVLNHHFPNAHAHGDITKTYFTRYANKIDILTGGFPCQPYSTAGKRLGKEDDRHLWPEMLRVIREVRPKYVVGENVAGIVSWNGGLVFDEVQTDLENEGYEVLPVILPACAVNAPHRRDRVWFIAYPNCFRNNTAKASKDGLWEQQSKEQPRNRRGVQINGPGNERTTANASGTGLGKQHPATKPILERFGAGGSNATIPDWYRFPTKPAILGGDDGLPTELDGITLSKWRKETIKAYGNAIVPQIAFQIFKAIQTCHDTETVSGKHS
jgi:DNA (cytosine-5)-methyltransferase 1